MANEIVKETLHPDNQDFVDIYPKTTLDQVVIEMDGVDKQFNNFEELYAYIFKDQPIGFRRVLGWTWVDPNDEQGHIGIYTICDRQAQVVPNRIPMFVSPTEVINETPIATLRVRKLDANSSEYDCATKYDIEQLFSQCMKDVSNPTVSGAVYRPAGTNTQPRTIAVDTQPTSNTITQRDANGCVKTNPAYVESSDYNSVAYKYYRDREKGWYNHQVYIKTVSSRWYEGDPYDVYITLNIITRRAVIQTYNDIYVALGDSIHGGRNGFICGGILYNDNLGERNAITFGCINQNNQVEFSILPTDFITTGTPDKFILSSSYIQINTINSILIK